jgi:phospholipid N-methyltransferase
MSKITKARYGKSSTGRGLFAKNFVRHPSLLGSVVPSSAFLCRRLVNQVDWRTARRVVELGPGVGTLSQFILDRMESEASLTLAEKNTEFVEFLRKRFVDPRVRIAEGCALTFTSALAREPEGVDVVFTGIPLSGMSAGARQDFFRSCSAALAPGGRLIVYQFRRANLYEELSRAFRQVTEARELLNILPAVVLVASNEGTQRSGAGDAPAHNGKRPPR